MVGIFSLRNESFNNDPFEDIGQVFIHLESVQKTQDTLKKYLLPDDELNLIDYRLNTIPLVVFVEMSK